MNRFAWSMSTALLLCAQILPLTPVMGKPKDRTIKPAAVVDGHVVPMDQVVRTALRLDRDHVVDQMIQAFVIDREAKRRGIVVTPADIDARVAESAEPLALIRRHQMSMTDLRDACRVAIEGERLTDATIPAGRLVHCRQILLRCSPDGVPKSDSGAPYTQQEAKVLLTYLA